MSSLPPSVPPSLPFVALCMPSRGLIHSRTLDATLAALARASGCMNMVGWFMSHDLPLPDAHETLAQTALAAGADFLWFVEEDVIPPADALARLIQRQQQSGAGVVLLDYPVGEYPRSSSTLRQPTPERTILYGGLGCTLIARAVLAALPRPWFDTSHEYALSRSPHHGGRYILTRTERACDYGGHDVAFCRAALAHGFTLAAVDDGGPMAAHARLRHLGHARVNHGVHDIEILDGMEA